MAQAKAREANAIVFFEAEMNARAERRHELENALRRALREGQLVLFYQPIVDRRRDEVIGAEALVRWRHPAWGMIPPAEFIPVAEKSGLIVEMGRWVVEEAVRRVSTWRANGLPEVHVSVNLSARELKRVDDLRALKQLIAKAPRGALLVEITESVLLEDAPEVIAFLSELRALGVRIALDDFGTGYSSLSYLRRFRFDVLKIDRSFVKDLESSDEDLAVVTAIVSMGHILGLDVVAEGVETHAQLERLSAAGCQLLQGFLFARPMPATDFETFMEAHQGLIESRLPAEVRAATEAHAWNAARSLFLGQSTKPTS